MSKSGTPEQKGAIEREKALYRYAEAFEQGDLDVIGNVLGEAEQDVVLGQMIMELHEGYRQEEHGAEKVVYEKDETYPLPSPAIVGISQPARTGRPAKRPGRVSTFLQMIAAVLVCALLVGGFLALFATRQGGTGRVNSSWCRTANPQLPGYSMILSGVAVVSANDVWAVGSYGADSGPQQFISTPLIEHWDGQQWRMMRTSRLPLGELRAVSAVSANDVWAVGSVTVSDILGKKASYRATLVEHWDGMQWSVVPSLNLNIGDNELMAVSARSVNDVWMVGSTSDIRPSSVASDTRTRSLVEHWDGKQFKIVSSPSPGQLKGITAIAPNDAWAVASYSQLTNLSVTEHWNGKYWITVTAPRPASGGILSAISAVSSQDVWAVGGLPVPGVPSTALAEHWDGKQWQIVPSASPDKGGTYSFESVAAVSADNVWAVGRYYAHNGAESPLIEHWDGKTWNIVSSPNPSDHTFGNYYLQSVSAADGHTVWGVGNGFTNTGADTTTLVERPCS